MTAPRTRLLLSLLAPARARVLAGAAGRAGRARVRIVGQNFTEADVVSHLYAALLDQAGFHATVTPLGGRDIYLTKLRHGDVQVAGDLLSSTTEAINQKVNGDKAVPVSSSDVRRTLGQLTTLGSAYGVRPLAPSRAQLTTAYAVTADFARRYHVASLSDLGRLHRPLALAASTDCDQRLDCADGLESVYGLTLSRVVPLGSGTPDSKAALVAGRVQLAQVATTDTEVDADAGAARRRPAPPEGREHHAARQRDVAREAREREGRARPARRRAHHGRPAPALGPGEPLGRRAGRRRAGLPGAQGPAHRLAEGGRGRRTAPTWSQRPVTLSSAITRS